MKANKAPIEKSESNDQVVVVKVKDALGLDTTSDENSLLGRRFLCRGSGGLIIGPSGAGKSSFALQFACYLAVGKSFFGIECSHKDQGGATKPLKVLVVQSENDDYEVAEVLQSIAADWNPTERQLLDKNLSIYCSWGMRGEAFTEWLDERVSTDKADVAFVDPLLSYCGGDVTKNQAVSEFMRDNINTILKAQGANTKQMKFGLVFVHHTGKPGSTPKDDETALYDMLGSSELTNWARFVMNITHFRLGKNEKVDRKLSKKLKKLKGRLFRLTINKRGNRSGFEKDSKTGKWSVLMQHSDVKGIKSTNGNINKGLDRLFWEPCDLDFDEETSETLKGGNSKNGKAKSQKGKASPKPKESKVLLKKGKKADSKSAATTKDAKA